MSIDNVDVDVQQISISFLETLAVASSEAKTTIADSCYLYKENLNLEVVG